MIYVMLRGELPPRGLSGIDERASVKDAKRAIFEVFKEDPEQGCRLFIGDTEMDDEGQPLSQYGVQRDALLHAELVRNERRAEAPVRL